MVQKVQKKLTSKKLMVDALPFTKENFLIFGVGLLIIAVGYIALAQPPWDGTLPLVVAPILLVLGYCVIIPLGIIYRKKNEPRSTNRSESQETR